MSRKKVLNDDNIDIRIGFNLKRRRRYLMINQTKVGEILGVSKGQISRYENGSDRISASNLYRLASYYGKDMNYFLRITSKELEMEVR